ncbi:type II secretion system F family protein [Phenylobacterium sp.]|uniref:type II secretion system F family protein n=1 Tax=Phenylobacterium sp. TaxID=1871053 RepID=UPI0035B24236
MIELLGALFAFALGLATLGGWLLLRALGGEARSLDRRLMRVGAPSGAEARPYSGPLAALDALVDRRWPGLRRRILAAGGGFTPVQLVLGSGLVAVAVFAALAVAGLHPMLALAAAAGAGGALPGLVLSLIAGQRRERLLAQLPQAVELIARSLQAGHPVVVAMRVVAQQMPGPIGPEFAAVLDEMSFGRDRASALRALTERYPVAELRMFAASLEVTRETGGNVAEVLLKLADDLRATAHLKRKAQAVTAEGRLSFWVISSLPFLVVAAIMLLRPDYYRDAAGDPLFWPLMSAPPLLWFTGAVVIWRMVNFRV